MAAEWPPSGAHGALLGCSSVPVLRGGGARARGPSAPGAVNYILSLFLKGFPLNSAFGTTKSWVPLSVPVVTGRARL